MRAIRKITTNGQVTLPSAWRKKFDTDTVVIKETKKGSLEIIPHEIDDAENWETIFDAVRDNDGKGIPAEEFIAALEKDLEK